MDEQTAQLYTQSSVSPEAANAMLITTTVFTLVLLIPTLAGMWKVFQKAGKPGWAAIVPIYNMVVLLEIIGKPIWWILIYLLGVIPFIGFIPVLIISVLIYNELSKSFGKGVGMTLLQLFLPFIAYPVLGFGKAQYLGPGGKGAGTPAAPSVSSTPPAQPPTDGTPPPAGPAVPPATPGVTQ